MEPLEIDESPMIPRPFAIQRVHRETADTFTVELKPASGKSPFVFSPGQFNMVYVYGVGEVPISISGDAANTATIVHTTRAVGMVTRAMKRLAKGDLVGIRGPFGTSWPIEQAKGKDVVVVAGGIGLPPLRPSLYSILRSRQEFRKVFLLYGARTPSDILFPEQIEAWRANHGIVSLITVDRSMKGWKGNVGVVTTLIPKIDFDPNNAVAMIVGPEVMMRFTAMDLLKRGIDPGNIYVSMERNMKCGIGLCGHCQYGPHFICKDGPVFPYGRIKDLLLKREI
ncbi:MAG TPA: FAD/NAD(P)-binding protein [Bacteroidota bacterium]